MVVILSDRLHTCCPANAYQCNRIDLGLETHYPTSICPQHLSKPGDLFVSLTLSGRRIETSIPGGDCYTGMMPAQRSGTGRAIPTLLRVQDYTACLEIRESKAEWPDAAGPQTTIWAIHARGLLWAGDGLGGKWVRRPRNAVRAIWAS